MRIGLVYDAVFPYVKGGAERRYHEIAKRLARRHEVHVFGMKYWPGPAVKTDGTGIILHGVCVARDLYVRGKRTISQPLYFAGSLLPHLFDEKLDVVDCASFPYFPMFTCKLYAVRRQVPLVATWLEYWGDYWFDYIGWRGAFGKLIERVASRLPDRMVAISALTRDALLDTGLDKARVAVIPPGIDLEDVEHAKMSGCSSDVIFVGRLVDSKGVDTLIRAVAALAQRGRKLKCCVVGTGPAEEHLKLLVRQLGLQGQVLFASPHEPEQVFGLMKASKVLVLPSRREGFGIVLLEASACGLPLITVDSRNNAGREMIENGANGYVCGDDVESLGSTIARVLGDERHRQEMGAEARRRAQGYSWDRIAEQVESVYMDLA